MDPRDSNITGFSTSLRSLSAWYLQASRDCEWFNVCSGSRANFVWYTILQNTQSKVWIWSSAIQHLDTLRMSKTYISGGSNKTDVGKEDDFNPGKDWDIVRELIWEVEFNLFLGRVSWRVRQLSWSDVLLYSPSWRKQEMQTTVTSTFLKSHLGCYNLLVIC